MMTSLELVLNFSLVLSLFDLLKDLKFIQFKEVMISFHKL